MRHIDEGFVADYVPNPDQPRAFRCVAADQDGQQCNSKHSYDDSFFVSHGSFLLKWNCD
jgi:hypothetical protein